MLIYESIHYRYYRVHNAYNQSNRLKFRKIYVEWDKMRIQLHHHLQNVFVDSFRF